MEISIEGLQEKNACYEATQWIKGQNTRDLYELYELAKSENHLDWCNWFLSRFLNRENKTRYAIFAAESVLHIYENRYSNNDAPRKAIKAAKQYLENPTEENRTAAAAAAAAYAAAYAAYAAAADAAYAAAYAAYAAAYAAYAAAADAAAADAAYAAADAAAYATAAAKKEMMIKILDYGLELLENQND